MFSNAVAALFSAVLGFIVATAAYPWLRTIAYCGIPPFWILKRMLDIDAERAYNLVPDTRIHTLKIIGGWLVPLPVFLILFLFSGSVWFAVIILWELGFVFLRLLQFALPPAVLYLGASREEATRSLQGIIRAVQPLRTISLIHPFPHLGPDSIDQISRMQIVTDEDDKRVLQDISYAVYRTRDPGAWHDVVEELMYLTPIVIVDARVISDDVVFETEFMLIPERVRKLMLLVSRKEGAVMLLRRLSPAAREFAKASDRFVTDDALEPVLHAITRPIGQLRGELTYPRSKWQPRR